MPPNLRKDALAAVKAALTGAGFAATRSRYMFVQRRTPGVHGWLGLNDNDTHLPELLIINPVVGVIHERIQETISELNPEFDRRGQPVVSCNLGCLTPEKTYRTWDFHRGGDPRGVAVDLAETLSVHARSFIDLWADWSELSERIADTDLLVDDEKYVVVPVVRALNGEVASALRMIDEKKRQVADSQDVYASFYRKYAESFQGRFS
ncbi:hypothetical protein [Nonomuraea sp. NPDC002799]